MEKPLDVSVNNRDGHEGAIALVAVKANHILGSISNCTASRSREVITAPHTHWSCLRLPIEYCALGLCNTRKILMNWN